MRDGTGLRRVDEHPHRCEQRRGQLLGPVDAVEEPRHRAEDVVDATRRSVRGSSSSCSTGDAARVAKMSPGSSSTGSRLMVARAAPVTMLVAPGPTDAVHASVESRLRIRANPAAACTMPCSLRAW